MSNINDSEGNIEPKIVGKLEKAAPESNTRDATQTPDNKKRSPQMLRDTSNRVLEKTSSVISMKLEMLAQPKRINKKVIDRYSKGTKSNANDKHSKMQTLEDYMSLQDELTPGPNQYDSQKNVIGRKHFATNLKNEPQYLMQGRTDANNKIVITGAHKVDKLGRDSPGVGFYTSTAEDLYKFVRTSNAGDKGCAFGRESRWKSIGNGTMNAT